MRRMSDDEWLFWIFCFCVTLATALALVVVWMQP